MPKALGIYRETQNSPDRVGDDAKILEAAAEKLERFGIRTELARPDILRKSSPDWDLVFPMCEMPEALRRLQDWESSGCLVINPPDSVLGCYRTRLVPALQNLNGALFPKTEILKIDSGFPAVPMEFGGHGLWIKRGDVHNTQDGGDVLRIHHEKQWRKIHDDYRKRGITHAVFQEHIEGELVKFYGVGPGKWFCWFYHAQAKIGRYPFSSEILQKHTALAAQKIGLEIFGGDAIIPPDGRIVLLDINSWPSFARFRNEASVQIAEHLNKRIQEHARTRY